jgi:serine/threonine protein phosphatase PrpC
MRWVVNRSDEVTAGTASASTVDPQESGKPARFEPGELRVEIAYRTDVGRARDHQEDSVGVFVPTDPQVLAQKGRLLVVADGMGGHAAGEIASQKAVEEVSRAYYADPNWDLVSSLAEAIQSANNAIYRQALAQEGASGMGTTVVAAVIRGGSVQIGSVGDSRAYLLRNRTIAQITEDHSWVGEQVRIGTLTPEQAAVHPQSNLLLRALGKEPAARPDFFSGELQPGDTLVLCSDGLIRHVSDAEILVAAWPADVDPDAAAQRLVDLANMRGGSDNVTVVVARAAQPGFAAPPPTRKTLAVALGHPSKTVLAVIATLAVLAAGSLLLALLVARQPRNAGSEPQGAQTGAVAPSAATGTGPASAPLAQPASLETGASSPPTRQTSVPTSSTQDAPAALLAAPQGLWTTSLTDATGQMQFAWKWDLQLPAGDAFEVRIWQDPAEPHAGAAEPGLERCVARQGTPFAGCWMQVVDVGNVPAVKRGGPGAYYWTVAVVRPSATANGGWETAGAEAKPGWFTYGGPFPTTTLVKLQTQALPSPRPTRTVVSAVGAPSPKPTEKPAPSPNPTREVAASPRPAQTEQPKRFPTLALPTLPKPKFP